MEVITLFSKVRLKASPQSRPRWTTFAVEPYIYIIYICKFKSQQ